MGPPRLLCSSFSAECVLTPTGSIAPASKRRQILKRGGWARDFARVKGRMAKLIKARKKSTSVKQTRIEPITCPHCGGQAYLMRRTLHPKIKGEIWTFECKNCGKQTEKSKLHYADTTEC